ncbi:hypothetical protein ATO11_02700 [Pseudaestuariivita atlantica]|uniref:Antitoxin Xre/MbcA/ParS-like toxin-binding domain-containing protein n=2 Tax=Pseudaestuariivita atlantica TaxID=1317121 RepID=A0A0L1JVA3_9RHOB|nr:hypothetical protein ATO11_02700 [Pseudaestuariivita atlantica]
MLHPDAVTQSGVARFMASLQEPRTPYISPDRLAEVLGMSKSGLSKALGLHRNTLRNPGSDTVQGKLQEVVRIIMRATELCGDPDRAAYWFRNEPIAAYRNQTALELVAAGHARAVMQFIEDLENGANG